MSEELNCEHSMRTGHKHYDRCLTCGKFSLDDGETWQHPTRQSERVPLEQETVRTALIDFGLKPHVAGSIASLLVFKFATPAASVVSVEWARCELWRKKNPEKIVAHNAVRYAVKTKNIIKPNICEICLAKFEKKFIHGHHNDYKKALDVKWLCPGCHYKVHHSQSNNL